MIGEVASEKSPGLVLLAHGDREPRWEKPFVSLKERLAATIGEHRVYLAYMYFPPTLSDALAQASEAGLRDIVILPLFLSLSSPTEVDIPRQVVLAKERLPHLNITLLPPIGEHPGVTDEIYFSALKAVTTQENADSYT